jgi:TolB protein
MKYSLRRISAPLFLYGVIILCVSILFSSFSLAEEEKVYIDIDSPGARVIPAAVAEFTPLDGTVGAEARNELYSALTGDLEFAGIFSVIEKEAHLEKPSLDKTDFGLWRAVGAELLVKGGAREDKGKLTAEFRLYDAVREKELFSKRYVGKPENPRALAHRFADDMLEKLTRRRGVFSTKLAFVSDRTGSKEIYISDYDGKNVEQLTNFRSITLTPRWSPDGKNILFTSFAKKEPHLYMIAVKGGAPKVVSAVSGLNIAGSFSPDGTRIALTLTGKKSPEIFILDMEKKTYTQITDNASIDVSSSWNPGGDRIAFASDASGKPQVYVIDFVRKTPVRITFEGEYNSQPVWSPDGKSIAFSGGDAANPLIWVARNGELLKLTQGGADVSPGWSPDGRHIVFSREKAGRSKIYIVSAAGGALREIDAGPGNSTSPSWSPWDIP